MCDKSVYLNPTIEERFYAVRNQMMKDAYEWVKICYPGIKGDPKLKSKKPHKFIPCHYGTFGPEKIKSPSYKNWSKDGDYEYCDNRIYPDGICDESYYSFVIAENHELRIVSEPSKNTYPVFKVDDVKSPAKRLTMLKAIAQTLIDDPDNIGQYVPSYQSKVMADEYIKCSDMVTA